MTEQKKQPRVLLFSTPTCGYCGKAKRYLKSRGVKLKEVDISRDPGAARDAQRMSGGTSVPVILIGNNVVIGFDRVKIDRLLGLKPKPVEEE